MRILSNRRPGQMFANLAQIAEGRRDVLEGLAKQDRIDAAQQEQDAAGIDARIDEEKFFGLRGEGVDTFGDVVRQRKSNRRKRRAERNTEQALSREERADIMRRLGEFFRRREEARLRRRGEDA